MIAVAVVVVVVAAVPAAILWSYGTRMRCELTTGYRVISWREWRAERRARRATLER